MDFRIGCALWAYKAWVGELFPPGSQATDFLSLYSHRFTTVEGNTTFYSVPDRKTVQRWASVTPVGFKFCLKLPKAITHDQLLQPKLAATMQFLEQMQDLGDRRGPFFAQLPPSYGPAYFDDLEAFLTALPRQESEFALEVRHPEWFQLPHRDRLTALLTELGIGRVLLDSRPVYEVSDDPQVHSERRKPKLPLQMSVTAPFSLIRFISHPEQQTNWIFLQDWLTQVEQWLQQGIRLYFFVHCPVEERSPSNARYIQHCLEQQGTAIPRLPWDVIPPEATQLQLF